MQRYMSNNYGEMEVIKQLNEKDQVIVRFLNTGYERKANIVNVRAGKVKDHSVKYVPPTEYINEVWSSNNTGDFLVIYKKGRKALIKFLQTGYTKEVHIENAKVGKVRDPYYPSVYGRGFEGEFERVPYWKQAKQLWCNMMKRCYSPKDHKGYYGKGVEVSDRWKCFANFLNDLPDLNNFEMWLKGFGENEVKYNLDKDLILEGNKTYTKHLCSFVTEYENKSAGAVNARKVDSRWN